MTSDPSRPYDPDLQREIAALIVDGLNLDISADAIGADDPLYGAGLGLDSIDILEIALLISKKYSLQLKANGEENHQIFASLRSLTEYVIVHRPA